MLQKLQSTCKSFDKCYNKSQIADFSSVQFKSNQCLTTAVVTGKDSAADEPRPVTTFIKHQHFMNSLETIREHEQCCSTWTSWSSIYPQLLYRINTLWNTLF